MDSPQQQQSVDEPTLDNLLWDSIASAIDKENIKIFSDKPNNDGKIPKYIDSKFTKQLTKKIEQHNKAAVQKLLDEAVLAGQARTLDKFIDEIGEYGVINGVRSENIASHIAHVPLMRACRDLEINYVDVYDSLATKYKPELKALQEVNR